MTQTRSSLMKKPPFAQYLKNARLRLGYSQEEFRALLGIGRMKLYEWEAGKRTPEKTEEFGVRPLVESLPAKKGAK